ncbi:hypothetical protein N2E71_09980, partial [Leuconostoc citreum]
EQLDLIEEIKDEATGVPLCFLLHDAPDYIRVFSEQITDELDGPILRYIGGDSSIEFKLQEQLYRLWRIDDEGDKVWFMLLGSDPDWTTNPPHAFTSPLEEIKKWQTPAWEIEVAD